MWGAAVAAYAAAVFQRGSFGVASIQAQHHLHASAAEISLFVVLQLAVYAGMQVPVGLLVILWVACKMIYEGEGPRRLPSPADADAGVAAVAATV